MTHCLVATGLALVIGILLFILYGWYMTEPVRTVPRDRDLPEGAQRYRGPQNAILAEIHDQRLEFLERSGYSLTSERNFEKVGGICSNGQLDSDKKELWEKLFNGHYQPYVDHYRWFQSFAFPVEGVENGYVLIYESWMVSRPGPRPYLICTLGEDISEEDVEQAVKAFVVAFAEMKERKEAFLRQKQ